jgi:PAS domain S-box-containing protein
MRPDPCEPYPCLALKAFLDGKTHQHETTVIDNQGENRFFECAASVALRDKSGKPVAVLETSRDITDKKKAEDALRKSEEKYRTLVERANDVICIVQDGIIKMCNPRLPEFWGGSIEEIIGKPISEFIHPDALTEVVDRYNRRMAGEISPSIYETVLMRKDGSKSYVELNAGIITYEGKNADLVIVRDINERKNATQAIRESEGRLRHLLDSTEDLIFLQDPEGRYLYFNAAPMYGLPVEKVLGSMPYDLLDRESADRIVKRLKKVAKTGQSIIEETMFIWKGQTLWFSDNLSPIRDAKGTITAVVTVSHNITDRKNSEKALRESEEKYRSLVTTTGDIIWETDDQAHFVFVSPQVESIIGFKPDELIGHTPFEFLKPDAIGPNQKMFRKGIENKEKSIVYISHWIHKNGHSVYLESHAVPIYRSDGSFSGFIGIERKKTL